MTSKMSAGLLMYRFHNARLQVLLAHPGGPFYRNKENGFWTIPKGEIAPDENGLDAAVREFKEETGITPGGEFIPLGTVRQKSGKTVHAWAFAGDRDEAEPITSNTFEMEWPPHSGIKQLFPEIDRALFFSVPEALEKVNEAQREFVRRLEMFLKENSK
ncbi:MAG: NUDIX domain-containing protein [Proteobacteria bacterium]|nr:NUDIX domain-containing protein [Pseudomonadota bacterium]